MNKLARIETFIQVVELQSFAKAAQKLHLTSAAISKQISSLEAELGVELLRRNTRKLSLTEIGEQYYEQAKKALAQLAEADAIVVESHKTPSGILKVSAARYFAENIILPNLADFLKQYPNINLHLDVAERMPDFIHEEIDIMFGLGLSLDSADIIQRRLFSTRYVLCASPCYLEKFAIPKVPQDLTKHQYLTHSMRPNPRLLKFQNLEVWLEPYLWINDSKALCEAAKQGLGIAKVHDYFARSLLNDGQLIELLSDYAEIEQPIYIYYRKARQPSTKIHAFVNYFQNKSLNAQNHS